VYGVICIIFEARVLDSRAYFELFVGIHNNASFDDVSKALLPGVGPSFGIGLT
jgi:hypothetical protein